MRRIVVSLLKGGVAKSETAVNLAHGLAMAGYKVLLVDTDVQAQCTDMLGVDPDKGLADLISTWGNPHENLCQARENLWLLAGGNDLAAVKMEIARREMAPEAVLEEALSIFEGIFDYMIVDTAPGWDTLLVNALYCSREVLSPVSMEPMALAGLMRFQERLSIIQRYNPHLELRWVVPTFVDGRVKKTGEIMAQLEEAYGPRLAPSIRYSVRLSEAPAYGQTIYEHDPRGAGADSYRALTQRIIEDAPAYRTDIKPATDQAPVQETQDEVPDLAFSQGIMALADEDRDDRADEAENSMPESGGRARLVLAKPKEEQVMGDQDVKETLVDNNSEPDTQIPRITGRGIPRLRERIQAEAEKGNHFAEQALREIRERFGKHGGA
jgi:chromosome partitioning protein